MDNKALQELLTTLIARWENEVVEFKRAGDGYLLTKMRRGGQIVNTGTDKSPHWEISK